MSDLLSEFKAESLSLIDQMVVLLESCEAGTGTHAEVEQFGLFADRIMGMAKQLLISQRIRPRDLNLISQFSQLCKILGYKSAQLGLHDGLWPIAIGVLLDSSEELKRLIQGLHQDTAPEVGAPTAPLLTRLEWLNDQFAADIDGGVPMSQVQQIFADIKTSEGDERPKR